MGVVFLSNKDCWMTVWKDLKECKSDCVTFIDFESSMVATILRPVTLTRHHRSFLGMDSSAFQLFTALLHHLPPLPFISLSNPLHRHWYSSSSSSSLSSVFLSRFFPSLPPFVYPPPHPKNTLFVRCLQSEQNIHQKPHFSCAIVKFA